MPINNLTAIAISVLILLLADRLPSQAQERKYDRLYVSSASGSAAQMPLWLTKEAKLYAKYNLAAEVVTIPGSNLIVQAMLSGEAPISQLGGPAAILADLSGADLVIVATTVRNFVFLMMSDPNIRRIEDLRGKAVGVTRFGNVSDFVVRFTLQHYNLVPDRDVAIIQCGGQPEMLAAITTGRIQAAALTAPGTVQARKLGLRALVDISKFDADFPISGIVTTRRYLNANENIVRRFLKAYIEGIVLAKKNRAFTSNVLARYLKTDDPEILNESYEWIIQQNISLPPYPATRGIIPFLTRLEQTVPKAKGAKPEDFVDGHLVKELDEQAFITKLLHSPVSP
jgi:NitT/TauT family transport system substrate-binding protein